MNFAFDYVKHKSKPQNDGFYFDIETPRGHFFAVLDFAEHDYANLNPSLKGKLETIVSSFVAVANFSADLFLGFLAKEINNFIHNLAEQDGGPKLSCSAALCLLSGDQLSFLLRGDTTISILNGGRLQQVNHDTLDEKRASQQLGTENIEPPMSDQVQSLTLHDDKVVLVMTRAMADALGQESPAAAKREQDPQVICDALMKASAAGGAGRTLVVISGPYQPLVDLAAVQLSQFERLAEQLAELKYDVGNKAAAIDVLELDEKVKNLRATLAGKADTAALLGLQRDVLKLGLVSNEGFNSNKIVAETEASTAPAAAGEAVDSAAGQTAIADQARQPKTAFTLKAALVVLVISLVAGFAGGWLGSRRSRIGPEVWSVKTSENQIMISRKDAGGAGNVTLTAAGPLKSTGEQTFSSFADVQRYIETITQPESPSASTSDSIQPTSSADTQASVAVTEITVKSGDSLKKLAQIHNVSQEKLMELNPGITRWPQIRIGQKIVVPSPSAAPTPAAVSSSLSTPPDQSPAKESAANTTEVTVGPGDSLNELARRFNTTAERLRELNPRMNWPRIQRGQRVLVPAPPGG